MVERQRTVWMTKAGLLQIAEFGEVIVSQNDTISYADNMSTVIRAYLIRLDTGDLVVTAEADTTSTVSTAVTDKRCVYIAFGEKL